ncbi:hypothetical protein [Jeotgalibacillus salarius]|uniref:Uncharacterized protein n=1 Tax=Jeotgalibacillus salarius TaxID=546023 RepID=A0A4Y8LJJ7_9BACL|nr:hypothetical protein [Jeotgalibacillus salarius]TFE02385.1 hypothetical protein E2626_07335 [Jeotgalibacillus salarius]
MNSKITLFMLLVVGNILLVLSNTLIVDGWPQGLMLGAAVILNITAGGGLLAMVIQQRSAPNQN